MELYPNGKHFCQPAIQLRLHELLTPMMGAMSGSVESLKRGMTVETGSYMSCLVFRVEGSGGLRIERDTDGGLLIETAVSFSTIHGCLEWQCMALVQLLQMLRPRLAVHPPNRHDSRVGSSIDEKIDPCLPCRRLTLSEGQQPSVVRGTVARTQRPPVIVCV